jgi:hypothetical protein
MTARQFFILKFKSAINKKSEAFPASLLIYFLNNKIKQAIQNQP